MLPNTNATNAHGRRYVLLFSVCVCVCSVIFIHFPRGARFALAFHSIMSENERVRAFARFE